MYGVPKSENAASAAMSIPVSTPGKQTGISTSSNVRSREAPRLSEASLSVGSSAEKASSDIRKMTGNTSQTITQMIPCRPTMVQSRPRPRVTRPPAPRSIRHA